MILFDTKWICSEKDVVRERQRERKKRNDLEKVLGLGEFASLHILLKFFNVDKITVATCSLGLCTAHIHPSPPFLIISRGVAKLKHPCSQRLFFPESGRKNILTCPVYLLTLPSQSVCPMFHCLVTFFHSIYPSYHSLLHSSFTHSFTHTKTRLGSQTKSCPCTKTDTCPAVLSLG